MVVLARLVTREDFGLVGMVAAFTGFLGLFRDMGLSMATVQRPSITAAQTSTLFWINLAAGCTLSLLSLAAAPALARFYGDQRLTWITAALGLAFLFYGAAAQHRALLQREMRFVALTLIEIISLVLGVAVSIGMAVAGAGYWALVAMTVVPPAVSTLGTWLAAGWVPGLPRRGCGVRSMLQYGGVITLNSMVVYLVYNAEKVLLGKFWGAEVLGVYGRAYTLLNLPTENLNSVMGSVMFPALSRVQQDADRLRSFFLKGYGLFQAIIMPITAACALFAEDIVRVMLGAQWSEAAPVFRLLTPTIVAFGLINPVSWLMQGSGRAMRSLLIAFLIAPVVVAGYLLGLHRGPQGVAVGYSVAMTVLVLPVLLWAKHGTLVTLPDLFKVTVRPVVSAAVAGLVAYGVAMVISKVDSVLLRLVVEAGVLCVVYAVVLLYGLGQKDVYFGLLQSTGLWKRQAG
jgi:PST family polysaccharide transporter